MKGFLVVGFFSIAATAAMGGTPRYDHDFTLCDNGNHAACQRLPDDVNDTSPPSLTWHGKRGSAAFKVDHFECYRETPTITRFFGWNLPIVETKDQDYFVSCMGARGWSWE